VYATRIGSRILQIFWKPPEPRKRNGDIIGYRLCIKEKRSSQPCRDYITFPESQMNMHSCDELKPFTVYNIHVEAKTVIGYGPGQYLDYRSGEAGMRTFICRGVSRGWFGLRMAPPTGQIREFGKWQQQKTKLLTF
jgi:hypothetical protein